jgi:YVTN family beta-propeller protein
VRFAVLGPTELWVEGRLVPLGGPKQRALLAFLLLHANEAVSRDRLIDALWGESPPPSASESLDAYVYRLRKLVGHDRLVRRGSGYVMSVEAGELDADRFGLLVTSAHEAADAGDRRGAARMLTEALALWRGPALADVLYEPFASAPARQLEERRLNALESRVEAELDIGGGAALVPDLEQLVADHPLRERLVAALMLALYRAGRQADALAAFQAARCRMVNELGLEPGPGVRELEQRILRHDPALAAPRRADNAHGPRARVLQFAAAALVLGAALTAGMVFRSGAAHAGHAALAGANGMVAVDTGSGRIVAATALSGTPEAVTSDAGSVWAADPGTDAITRIAPGTGAVADQIPVGGEPGSIVSGGGAIWAASTVGATVTRIDPSTESVTQTVTLPGSHPVAMAYGDGRLWVADSGARDLFELDPATGSRRRTLSLDVQPSAVTLGDGAVWVAGYNDATVEKIAPASGKVIGRAHVGNGPVALAFGAGSLWVANSLDASISRVDPATLAVGALIPVGSGPAALAAGSGSVWVANQYSRTISRIDSSRDQVAASVGVGGSPTSLTMSGGRLWVGVAADSGRHRGGTLVIVTPQGFGFGPGVTTTAAVDPAFYFDASNPQFIGLAYDTLVTFQKSPGAAGARLVPDLVLAIPAPTDGGRAYTFRLRPGIRYSDGQRVQASDFRRGIERLFRVHSPGMSYFAGIIGGAACAQQPASCDLSRGIVTDDATGTVVFHLTAPDPQFLFNLTVQGFSAPVPPGTPDHETGSHTMPGTGPYKITTVGGTQVRFARNPFFREWSHAAQPDGNPDAIVWRTVPTAQDAVTAIEHGRADWMFGLIPRAQYRQLILHDPAQVHSSPEFAVEFAPLNTHRAPFNDVRVRRALNYAINRNTIVKLYGGPSFATPTCQPIMPGLPGYQRYCPYTLRPRPDGAWTAPNLARARRLVSESGTRGERVDVWGQSDNAYIPHQVPAYVAGVLRSLGYRVHLHLAPSAAITQAMRTHFQLSADGDWGADYPDPSSYLPQFFGCGGGNGNGYYCSPPLDRKMQQAGLLEFSDPAEASARWESIDRQLTNAALWVPTVNPREVEVVSKRLHNYEYNPVWGFLADQSWLGQPQALATAKWRARLTRYARQPQDKAHARAPSRTAARRAFSRTSPVAQRDALYPKLALDHGLRRA